MYAPLVANFLCSLYYSQISRRHDFGIACDCYVQFITWMKHSHLSSPIPVWARGFGRGEDLAVGQVSRVRSYRGVVGAHARDSGDRTFT
jgi:hypothetical protein